MWGAGKLEKRRMGRRGGGGGMGVRDVVRVEHIGNLFYVGAALLLSIRDAVGTLYTTGKEELKLCKFKPRLVVIFVSVTI